MGFKNVFSLSLNVKCVQGYYIAKLHENDLHRCCHQFTIASQQWVDHRHLHFSARGHFEHKIFKWAHSKFIYGRKLATYTRMWAMQSH